MPRLEPARRKVTPARHRAQHSVGVLRRLRRRAGHGGVARSRSLRSQHALWLDIVDFGSGLAPNLRARFNTSVFDEALADQAVGELLHLLDAMLADPDAASSLRR